MTRISTATAATAAESTVLYKIIKLDTTWKGTSQIQKKKAMKVCTCWMSWLQMLMISPEVDSERALFVILIDYNEGDTYNKLV